MATHDLFRVLAASADEPVEVRDKAALPARALSHGLSGAVLRALDDRQVDLPADVRMQLLRDSRALAGQALKLRMLLTRTLRALAAEKVVPVVLKGYPLAQRIYPDPLLRPSTDVDIFVQEEELAATERAMKALALRPQEEAARDYFRAHHHHVTYRGQAGMVEVHFRLITGFAAALDWKDLRPTVDAQLDDLRFRRLSAEDELSYLAIHAAQHVFVRLSWLYDLRRFVDVEKDLDWSRVTDLASSNGFAVPLWAALNAARHCFHAAIPQHVIKQLRPSHARAAALDALLSPAHLHDGFFHDRQNLYFAQLLMTATANRALRFAAHHGARAAKRRIAGAFPGITPPRWRG